MVFDRVFRQTLHSDLKRRLKLAAVPVVILLISGITAPMALADSGGHGYDSIPHRLPGNLPSLGFEATQTSEFGNQITFAGPTASQRFGSVEVTMSSWGCQTGRWFDDTCATEPGSTFTEPITLSLYNPPAPGSSRPGSLILSVTQTFTIPFRPSDDDVRCPPIIGDTSGRWFDPSSKSCFHGLATNITFDIGSAVSLPSSIVFGIAYNTSTAGYTPYGVGTSCFASFAGCGYDSLNVAMSEDPTDVSAGTDPNPGTVFWNTATAANYCDGGTNGVGRFRLDSPGNGCWSDGAHGTLPALVPAVRFKG